MKAVGVKELKARLSEYLRYVKAGEPVLITDRGEVVAELRPTAASYAAPGPDPTIEALESEGELTPPLSPKAGWTWDTPGRGLPRGTAAELLTRLREER
jgi:prevent-host-death family protein